MEHTSIQIAHIFTHSKEKTQTRVKTKSFNLHPLQTSWNLAWHQQVSVMHLNLSSMPIFSYTFTLHSIHKFPTLHSIMHSHFCLFFHHSFARHVQTISSHTSLLSLTDQLVSYSSPNFYIPDPISNCHTTYTSQTFHFHYI